MQKNKLNFLKIILLPVVLIFIFLTLPNNSQGANFSLEITNIKPAGTGSPAIPSTNRIFRAYPGIEYNIRAAVIGGLYPYTYSLSNQPEGMTINYRTGEISWPNPQSDSGIITLSVTDSENNTVTTTWEITISTSGFIFVNGSYAGTETGTIDQPYRSLRNLLDNETNLTDIVYFRSGIYQMVEHNNGSPYGMNLSSSPSAWLAYPGENVVLQGGSDVGQARRIAIFKTFYFDGLTVKDVVDYGIMTSGSFNYKTVRGCVFDGLVPKDDINNNYGFIHTTNDSPGYYFVIQDNEFKNWRQASAIGSLYNDKKALIENNYIHDNLEEGTPTGIGITLGISPKVYVDYLTVRGNKVVMNTGNLLGGMNAAFYDSANIEINNNLFVKLEERGGHIFEWECGDHQGDTYYWRNTLIGDLSVRCSPSGPYWVNNNVIVNPNTKGTWFASTDFITHGNFVLATVLIDTNNLKNTDVYSLVNPSDEYKLIESQFAYIGTHGWQLPDGLTPLELLGDIYIDPPNSPTGLSVL
ncbi:MAG: Ig domain-containing protein [Candidatus Moraniibacteriota bacterium]